MRTIGKKLASREEAVAYNTKLFEGQRQYGGCTASRACPECLHIISDSVCCCMGLGTCDNCGHKDPPFITAPAMPIGETLDFSKYFAVIPESDNRFQYLGDWPKDEPVPKFTEVKFVPCPCIETEFGQLTFVTGN